MFACALSITRFGGRIINESTLDLINSLSNERQQLWRIAHRDKFSEDWWKRHDRIHLLNSRIAQLWALRRLELAADSTPARNDPLLTELFVDFRERAGLDANGVWLIEDEAYHERHYLTVEAGFRDNQYAHYLKKTTKKQRRAAKIKQHTTKTRQLA